MKFQDQKTNSNAIAGIAEQTGQRYNDGQGPPVLTSAAPFASEDGALGYLAKVLVGAYFEQKKYAQSKQPTK
jgi:hypothetical protein